MRQPVFWLYAKETQNIKTAENIKKKNANNKKSTKHK